MTQMEAEDLQALNVQVLLTADQVAREILEAVTEDRHDLTLAPNLEVAELLQIMKDGPDKAEQIFGENYRRQSEALSAQK